MKSTDLPLRLEDLANIGRSIAADLRSLAVITPIESAVQDLLELYQQLGGPMGKRHDPCVFHTLLAADHFLKTRESLPWWKFTEAGRDLLKCKKSQLR
jgi:hypothetical protein